MIARGQIRAGMDSLSSSRIKNFWTMFGIIIGVSSVITIVGLGEGIKSQIQGQIHTVGSNFITVRPQQLSFGSSAINNDENLLSGLSLSGPLTANDIATVEGVKGLSEVAPMTIADGKIIGDNGNYTGGFVIGTSSDLPSLLNQSVAFGNFFSKSDEGDDVAVLGFSASEKLFNEDVPLGHTFIFHGKTFIVKGVFNQFNTSPLSEQANLNNAIFIPNQIAEDLTNNTAPTYEILARPTNAKDTKSEASKISQALNKSHGGQSQLSVIYGNQNFTDNNTIVQLLTQLIAGVAAISLIVGGVGIMNVMLVSVSERVHEIGIRKAVGASNKQILSQFLIESTLLSLYGGIIGILLAFIIDIFIRAATTLTPEISWQIVVLAAAVSFIVGITFGTIPAVSASRKNPIDALRAE